MIADEIKKIVGGEVFVNGETLEKYSRDASIFKVTPEVVVFPRNSEDISQLVNFAKEKKKIGQNISLTARAAGTDMSGGPLTESIVLGFTPHFNRIKEITNDSATVEPGVFYRDLEAELDKRNLFFPSYPASKQLCAIGGMVANNAGGEKTLLYGKTENYLKELKVIFDDGKEHILRPLNKEELAEKMKLDTREGEIYRKIFTLISENQEIIKKAKPKVSKNSAGYALWNVWNGETFDLAKLFCGSQGTLGILTEATLKLLPKKKFSRLTVIFLRDASLLGQVIQKVLSFKPESFESYDKHSFSLALKFFPSLLKNMKLHNMISLALQFIPEFLMLFRSGLPEMVLLAEFSGENEEEVEKSAQSLAEAMRTYGIISRVTKSQAEAEKYWVMRRESFNLLRKHASGKHTAPFIDDVIVPTPRLPEFLSRLSQILDKYKNKWIYTVAGHMGDGNFHIIPLMDLKDPEIKKLIPQIGNEVYDLVLEFGGSITAEHNDGLIRSPYLKKMYGNEIYALFEDVKKIFDPLNIFNPGKKVNFDLNYSLEHILAI